MYAPHAPLWAVTYHAFQTSSHGKYRLMAKQSEDEETKQVEEKTPDVVQPPKKKQKEKRKIRTEILKKKREKGE